MAVLRRIHAIHTTSHPPNADTNITYCLVVSWPGCEHAYEFPDLSHNERECGRTDSYSIDVSGRGVPVNAKLVLKMTRGEDGWLPSSVRAIGERTDGRHCLMACHPAWPNNKWFDRNNPERRSWRQIS